MNETTKLYKNEYTLILILCTNKRWIVWSIVETLFYKVFKNNIDIQCDETLWCHSGNYKIIWKLINCMCITSTT